MLKIYTQMRKHDFGVLRNGPTWGKSKKKNKLKKKFVVKKSLNKKLPDFFFYISRTNPWNKFNWIRIFKNLQSNSKVISYVLNNNFSYNQLTLAFVPQIAFKWYRRFFSISFFFLFFLISVSCRVLSFIFFFFRKILISFTCFFLKLFFVPLIIVIL